MLSATETTSCSKKQLFQNRIENEVVDGRETNGKGGESTQVGKNVMETKSGDSIPQASSTAKVSHPVPLKNYATGQICYDTLHASESADQVSLNILFFIIILY